ncbi:LacI family DNA-binding transcriptional regulator [Streptomyces puniciscabiei]
MATLKDVARAAGVSAMTVSNVLNNTGRASDAVRAKVRRAAEEVGYAGPDPAAASLRRGRTGTLGVVLPVPLDAAFADPAATAFLQGVAHEFQHRDTGMTLLALPPDSGPIGRHDPVASPLVSSAPLASLERAVIDAALLYSVEEDHPGLDVLAKRKLPVLAVDSPGPESGHARFGAAWAGFVTVDDHAGAAQAARHLLGLGHRRAVVLVDRLATQPRCGTATWPQALATTSALLFQRLSGYRDAWTEAGLPEESLTVVECGSNDPESARAALRPLLAERRPFTAVLAVGDLLALGACQAARECGLGIPDDLSLVGFDDIAAAAVAAPPLTTVRQPTVDKGRAAARTLLDNLGVAATHRSTPVAPKAVENRTSLPTQLVVRSSTARSAPDRHH